MRPRQTFKNLPFQRKDYLETKMRYLQRERSKQKGEEKLLRKKEKGKKEKP